MMGALRDYTKRLERDHGFSKDLATARAGWNLIILDVLHANPSE